MQFSLPVELAICCLLVPADLATDNGVWCSFLRLAALRHLTMTSRRSRKHIVSRDRSTPLLTLDVTREIETKTISRFIVLRQSITVSHRATQNQPFPYQMSTIYTSLFHQSMVAINIEKSRIQTHIRIHMHTHTCLLNYLFTYLLTYLQT